MEIINIEQLMIDKMNECRDWLCGKEDAVARLAECEKAYESARLAYETAKADVEDYNEENIERVVAYREDLERRLGIAPTIEVAEPVAEAEVVDPEPQVAVGIVG